MKQSFLFILAISFVLLTNAQRRTAQPINSTSKTVTITSEYKPVLKPSSKINFSAATPVCRYNKAQPCVQCAGSKLVF